MCLDTYIFATQSNHNFGKVERGDNLCFTHQAFDEKPESFKMCVAFAYINTFHCTFH